MMFSSGKPKRERGPKNCKKREEQNTKGKMGNSKKIRKTPEKKEGRKQRAQRRPFRARMLEDKRQERTKFQLLELQWQYDVWV
jgi:hypothetical protein